MRIAVVILNWNGKKLLEQFLPSVVAYSQQADLYLADNASTDDSLTFVREHFPSIKIIENKENGGYAKGYNDALKQIDAEIFCLLNSDIEVTKNWLDPILKTFQNEPNTAIIQPKILDYKRKDYFEYAGAAGGYLDKFGYPFCRGRIFDSIERDKDQYKDATIFWASGACLFIRSEVYRELNGFDENFFSHFEEIDLCWRAFNQGFKAKYVCGSTVYHVGGATLNNSNPKKTYLNFRNSLFALTKNAGGPIFLILLTRLVLDGISGVKYLVELKPLQFTAIVKGHFSFYYHLPKLLNQRKHLKQNVFYYNTLSIVWSYFIKKIKHFDCL